MKNEAIVKSGEIVKYLKTIATKKHYGSGKLNYGKGENYGNVPLEYSIIFSVGDKYFHFFTSDMRYYTQPKFYIRTCEHEKDFRGGMNHIVESVEDTKNFLKNHGVDA